MLPVLDTDVAGISDVRAVNRARLQAVAVQVQRAA
ncbi:hypothetical protein SALB_00667 [Streptomyces noursei]|uniref:Uncharacterized protein n=1 Tax=Streptomyces noursei TaxID=1971 RepID=A0A401QRQ4_STRNR|nr:hypothetical protein SALB_00650 [Streptomyces noursei]GCB87998.1 hypothetical protein SALB_00667 [Streptomyces noursei]